MVLASGTQAELRYIKEVTRGTTPGSPNMTVLRATNRAINPERETLETDEVRGSGQVADVRLGAARVVGSPGYEISLQSYDDLIENGLRNTWGTVTIGGVGTLTTSGNDFVRSSGSWITDGVRVGSVLLAAGFTPSSLNGLHIVIAVTATNATVVSSLAAVSVAGTIIQPGRRIDSGTNLQTWTVERAFKDIGLFQVFTGVSVNQLQFSLRPGTIVGGSAGLLGMTAPTPSGTPLDASPTAAPTTTPLSVFEATLLEGGVVQTVATSLEINVNNNNSLEAVIGTPFSPDVFQGTQRVNGTLTVMLEDATILNKFYQETESSIIARMLAPNLADFICITLPRVKYLNPPIDPPQQGPVTASLPFLALESTDNATSITIQRSNT